MFFETCLYWHGYIKHEIHEYRNYQAYPWGFQNQEETMRFSKSAAALAIVFAVTVIGGPSTYADASSEVVIARDPSHAQSTSQQPEATPTPVEVTLASGDNLTQIATKYQTTVDEIVRLNAIIDPNVISVGTVIKVAQGEQSTEGTSYDQLRAAASAFITPPAPVEPL